MNPIEEFYNNATVLVTGANGFLGSVLVEKLLRCFEVKKIYVLMRSKAGKSVAERMKSFLKISIFDQIRLENAKFFEKLVAVEVDYLSPDLNIESSLLQKIKNEVEIFFHSMASVNFNNTVSNAVKTNILGTEKIVNLAKQLKNLKSFIHVSTLFSNVNDHNIDEKIYPSSLSYQKFIEIGLKITNRQHIIDNEILNPDKLPNAYNLSKHFAEKLVNDQASELPAGIYRPPTIVSSYKDHPGYTDNLNGPAGLYVGVQSGLVHCTLANPDANSNIAPVDYCSNALIAMAWDVHKNFKSRQNLELPILNHMSAENNLSWTQLDRKIPLGLKPSHAKIWKLSYFLVQTRLAFTIFNFLLHTIPAFILDIFALLFGRKRIYSKMMKRFSAMIIAFWPFTKHHWTFGNKNYRRLVDDTIDYKFQRGEHTFDLNTIDWDEFFKNFLPGVNQHVQNLRNGDREA